MNPAQSPIESLESICEQAGTAAAAARPRLAVLTPAQRTDALRRIAASIRARSAAIVAASQASERESAAELSPAMLDRLRLTPQRVESMAASVDQIAAQPDPVGRIVEGRTLPNGIRLEKRRVPIGVVLVIYEARPNVTSDAAALCLKSGNAVVLKGGKEAARVNREIIAAIHEALVPSGLQDAVRFVDTPERRAVDILVKMRGVIDLAIPRGGPGLINAVCAAATIPVVKHDAGNCHVYIDEHLEGLEHAAENIVVNAKAQRPGVCNAAETLLIHQHAAPRALPRIGAALARAGVELRACPRATAILASSDPRPATKDATEEDWKTEYLELILAVRVVDSLQDACEHIRRYGSQHTEAIVTSSLAAAERFTALVDSASVMVNCSTRFADGGEYGLGAEIGISTDKLHARGPMGAEDLTTFQWVLHGSGQTRD